MATKSMAGGILKRYLKQVPKKQLAADLAELFTKFEPVREYYQAKFSPPGDAALGEKYKALVKNEFFPRRGDGKARLSIARKAISDYAKLSPNHADLIDLMLYYVEMGVAFTNEYGDIHEAFYSSMEGMYEKALKAITKQQLQKVFQGRCGRIVRETSDIGWGFHDTLGHIYYQHYDEAP